MQRARITLAFCCFVSKVITNEIRITFNFPCGFFIIIFLYCIFIRFGAGTNAERWSTEKKANHPSELGIASKTNFSYRKLLAEWNQLLARNFFSVFFPLLCVIKSTFSCWKHFSDSNKFLSALSMESPLDEDGAKNRRHPGMRSQLAYEIASFSGTSRSSSASISRNVRCNLRKRHWWEWEFPINAPVDTSIFGMKLLIWWSASLCVNKRQNVNGRIFCARPRRNW